MLNSSSRPADQFPISAIARLGHWALIAPQMHTGQSQKAYRPHWSTCIMDTERDDYGSVRVGADI
jgi:hypothetical protein